MIITRIFKKLKQRVNFYSELTKFKKQSESFKTRFSLKKEDHFPCMNDNTASTGFDRHYVYHTAWAVHFLFNNKIEQHTDISSTLYLSGTASSFCKVHFYDYRPAKLELPNLSCKKADLTDLHFKSNSIESLSCMHTVEHVGLGRYGDPFDYDGDLKAMKELARVLAFGGNLLFVVPIGSKPRIQFNAHRIYTKEQIIDFFEKEEGLKLKEFTLIPENEKDGGLIKNPSTKLLDSQSYGCGCFVFTK